MSQLPTISALGTQFYIEIFDTDIDQTTLNATYGSVQCLLLTFEEQYSRFKESSLVSQLNTNKILSNPTAQFIELVTLGQKLYDDTDGMFNMLVGETLNARGYDSNYSFIANAEPKSIPNPHDAVTIETGKMTLTAGHIDLGGYGKGFVIDLIAKHLKTEYGFKYFLINGGGDMYGTSDNGTPIIIYLEHPTEPYTYIGSTSILNCGFAASSPHKRSWVHNGTTYHHIIHTQTESHSAKLCDASFVIADTCVKADAFATIALMVETKEFKILAEKNRLAFALFTNPTTLTTNQAFVVQGL